MTLSNKCPGGDAQSRLGHTDSIVKPLSLVWQEYWSELPFPSPGDLPDPGMEPKSPALQADSLPLNHQASQKDTLGCLNQISGNDGTKTVQELVSQMTEEDILS